jgi:hypothetical protein
MQEKQLLSLVCYSWSIETYETGIDERQRNESKTHFEQTRDNCMQIIFPLTDQWTLNKYVQIRTPFQTQSVLG